MILEKRKVTFLEAVKDFWKGYFDFRGRSKRSGYWWAILFIYLVYAILITLGDIGFKSKSVIANGFGGVAILIWLIFALATIIPKLMLSFRRWRDVGLTGKCILLYFIMIVSAGVISSSYTRFGNMLLSLFSILSFVLYLLPSNQLTTKSNNGILRFLFRQP